METLACYANNILCSISFENKTAEKKNTHYTFIT